MLHTPLTRLALVLLVLYAAWSYVLPVALAAEVTDATGRTVTIPDRIDRVLPAGSPAAVLLAAIAPARMIGLPVPRRTPT